MSCNGEAARPSVEANKEEITAQRVKKGENGKYLERTNLAAYVRDRIRSHVIAVFAFTLTFVCDVKLEPLPLCLFF